MSLDDAKQAWRTDGFVVVPAYLPGTDSSSSPRPASCFPPPGHPFWTAETLSGTALRYPRLDLTPWTGASGL